VTQRIAEIMSDDNGVVQLLDPSARLCGPKTLYEMVQNAHQEHVKQGQVVPEALRELLEIIPKLEPAEPNSSQGGVSSWRLLSVQKYRDLPITTMHD